MFFFLIRPNIPSFINRLQFRANATSPLSTINLERRKLVQATYDTGAATHRRVCEPVIHIHGDTVSLISRQKWSRKLPIDKSRTAVEPIGSDVGCSEGPIVLKMTTIH